MFVGRQQAKYTLNLYGIIMKTKDEMLQEQIVKLAQIEAMCNKHLVRCPASTGQAYLKAMSMAILQIIKSDDR